MQVVGRGGGVGWAIVEQDGGGHALVPESYLELDLFFVTYFFFLLSSTSFGFLFLPFVFLSHWFIP